MIDDYATAQPAPRRRSAAVSLVDPGVERPPTSSSTTRTTAYRWRADTHAAELAYILYQVPVLMAVHAAEMLEKAG